jgi:hypothetical protein
MNKNKDYSLVGEQLCYSAGVRTGRRFFKILFNKV